MTKRVAEGMITEAYVADPAKGYPEARVTAVHFMNDEIQIEQGRGGEPLNPKDPNNDVISLSKNQALELAAQIAAVLNKE